MHPLHNLEIEVCLPFLDPVIGISRRCLQRNNCMERPRTQESMEMTSLARQDSLSKRRSPPTSMRDIDIDLNDDGKPDPNEPLFDFYLEEGEDAMTRLGFGIVSYFGLI